MDASATLPLTSSKPKPGNLQRFMGRTIILLSVFFFVSAVIQLVYLQGMIYNNPKVNMEQALSGMTVNAKTTPAEQLDNNRLKALVVLEKAALENQYHTENMLLMSRVWISYIGFITGMIMAIVGVVFILGKLRIGFSEVAAKVYGNDLSFKTASPGLILSILGSCLMITTLVVNHPINGTQNAIYLQDLPTHTAVSISAASNKPSLPAPDSANIKSP